MWYIDSFNWCFVGSRFIVIYMVKVKDIQDLNVMMSNILLYIIYLFIVFIFLNFETFFNPSMPKDRNLSYDLRQHAVCRLQTEK